MVRRAEFYMTQSTENKWLEKVFAAEVEGRLPFQSKAAILKRLEAAGLVQAMVTTMGNRFHPVTVSGWQLTHAGRLSYCMSCDGSQSGDNDRE